ncbi:MAG: beta-ketoacyl-[acyl-carrier-protein] synthase family protein [Edaphobacter sp.]|uniref:beta-ketoacyl-[acyl-carrier-protein] synthase family protein n=1 Tax=Edaphobacter sp. TaxID=1934404 RepID=UPI0023947CAC|nr:beta-ketoacyl-[acyl-carrier-protein] synthase family protein [Edaphobacter sp.]MDE1178105.1 beta-ketoacyl-[acyl-carrier-protein] synthase family protein [Edaphobacter sp.]
MNRVVITGLGCVTPIGSTVSSFRESLFAGKTGITPIVNVADAPDGNPGVRYKQAAQIFDFDASQHLDSGIVTSTNRNTQLAIVAARQAVEQAELMKHHAPGDIAIIMGCACGGRSSEESEVKKLYLNNARAHPLTIVRTMASAGASNISIDLKITGPTLDISTACASSTHAIGLAFHMVRSGMATAALCGGHDAPLSFGFYRAWDSMRVVSPTQCKPYAADRDGMSLGEGAAMLVIETLESAQARNATIFGELVGFGMSADANHITQPQADGAAAAMRKALADGNIAIDEVGYINAHGTGTQANDATESAAIHQVFGERASQIPLSSTKSLHGHSIGASGALEALATILALQEGRLPHTAGVTNPDPALKVDLIINEPRPTGPTVALSNSLAFGGLNAVIAIKSWP